jgi:hypothetical protein
VAPPPSATGPARLSLCHVPTSRPPGQRGHWLRALEAQPGAPPLGRPSRRTAPEPEWVGLAPGRGRPPAPVMPPAARCTYAAQPPGLQSLGARRRGVHLSPRPSSPASDHALFPKGPARFQAPPLLLHPSPPPGYRTMGMGAGCQGRGQTSGEGFEEDYRGPPPGPSSGLLGRHPWRCVREGGLMRREPTRMGDVGATAHWDHPEFAQTLPYHTGQKDWPPQSASPIQETMEAGMHQTSA